MNGFTAAMVGFFAPVNTATAFGNGILAPMSTSMNVITVPTSHRDDDSDDRLELHDNAHADVDARERAFRRSRSTLFRTLSRAL